MNQSIVENILAQSLGIAVRTYGQTSSSYLVDCQTKVHVRDISTSLDLVINDKVASHLLSFGIPVISEETYEGSSLVPSNSLWALIDPLDGTLNYASGINSFGTSIAILDGDKILSSGVASFSLGLSIYTRHRDGSPYVVKSRSLVPTVSSSHTLPLVLAYGPELNSEEKQVLSSILFNMDTSVYPGFHRIGSSVEAFIAFSQGRYSSFLTLRTRPWDIFPILHLASCMPGVEVMISTHKPIQYSYIYNKSCLYASSVLQYLNRLSSVLPYERNMSLFE